MKRALYFLFVAFRLLYCEGSIRLSGGKSPNEGRVEILYNGTWGTVCDDSWDLNDANVVCRSLGLPNAASSLCCAAFGKGSGPILLDNVHCQGHEESLFHCQHNGWRSHNCGHGEDAGVVCGKPKIYTVRTNNLSGVIESPGYPQYMRQVNYQWTFSNSVANAQVAVYFDNIDLRRYHGGMSKITVVDSRNTSFLSVQNQRHHPVGFLITNPPLMISFYSSYQSRIGHSGNGIRMRYFVFSGSDKQSR
ncbi:deleted in malignant brain tumors 1 protein-like [Actinia tenebrosa]|uniref:Deleted in malignant brain tumors 1 protein-like n=1 Tax=Actinia tenebrosa TaxID=6105 RepID=A0A6P8J090_ACTTE|nr:deleted in malignant brain tumors 1 protein-like [Actinia tenebrosa]